MSARFRLIRFLLRAVAPVAQRARVRTRARSQPVRRMVPGDWGSMRAVFGGSDEPIGQLTHRPVYRWRLRRLTTPTARGLGSNVPSRQCCAGAFALGGVFSPFLDVFPGCLCWHRHQTDRDDVSRRLVPVLRRCGAENPLHCTRRPAVHLLLFFALFSVRCAGCILRAFFLKYD